MVNHEKGATVLVRILQYRGRLTFPYSESTDSESRKGVPITILVRITGPQCILLLGKGGLRYIETSLSMYCISVKSATFPVIIISEEIRN